jgi:hypothetical protein
VITRVSGSRMAARLFCSARMQHERPPEGRPLEAVPEGEAYARVILPAFMHFVQTLTCLTWPLTIAVTF